MLPTRVKMPTLAAVVATFACLGDAPALSQDANRSAYTTLDLKSCRVLAKHKDGNAWVCSGLPGYPVYVAEGDLRFFLSAGSAPEKRRAARQSPKPFNTLFPAAASRATIEWRVTRNGTARLPYATIVRYHTERDGAKGQVLVVSKVTPLETCHVALIDALANADANALARRLADETAAGFDCKMEPTITGERGRSPM